MVAHQDSAAFSKMENRN